MRILAAIAVLSACRPGPGETRCTTSNVYGTMMTNCKSGPPLKAVDDDEDEDSDERPVRVAAPPPPAVFWCSTRIPDGFGYCALQPGECEAARGSAFGPCVYQGYAICASSGCFTTPESCAKVERLAKRDVRACVLRR